MTLETLVKCLRMDPSRKRYICHDLEDLIRLKFSKYVRNTKED